MASLKGLAVTGCQRLHGVSLRSAPVAVGFLVMLNVEAGESVAIIRGGSIKKGELLNKELEREMGDGT